MAMFKIALLLFICLQSCALTSDFNIKGLQNVPDALRATQNGDVCKDCTQIFELLTDLVSRPDVQKKLIGGIESLCKLLPAVPAQICKDEVEKLLPVAINLIIGFVKPAEVCKIMGLCGSLDRREEMLRYFAKEACQVAVTRENVEPTNSCSFCIFLVKSLAAFLPKQRTENEVIELLEKICRILPSSFRGQCRFVIGKFSKEVLDAFLSHATPQAICSLIKMCGAQDVPLLDPCTLTAYRCRDIETAMKCGTVFFCQKFAWPPLNEKL